MKKYICFLLLFFSTIALFAEIDFSKYIAITMEDPTPVYDKPGILSTVVLDEIPIGEELRIVSISENSYELNGSIAHFYSIDLGNNEVGWVFGRTVLIADTTLNNAIPWYKHNSSFGKAYLYFFKYNNSLTYLLQDKPYLNVVMPYDLNPIDDIRELSFNELNQQETSIRWNTKQGLISVNMHSLFFDVELKTQANYDENLDIFQNNAITNEDVISEDEEFWIFFKNSDYENILELRSRGYENTFVSSQKEDSPLFIALQNNDLEMAAFLLNNGFADGWYIGPEYYETVMRYAVKNSDEELVSFLLSQGVTFQQRGYDLMKELAVSIRNSDPEMTQYLIDCGFDIHKILKTVPGGSIESSQQGYLSLAVEYDQIEIVQILLDEGININEIFYDKIREFLYCKTALDLAKTDEMRELLINNGALSHTELTLAEYDRQRSGLETEIVTFDVITKDDVTLQGTPVLPFRTHQVVEILNSTDEPEEINGVEDYWYLIRRDNGDYCWVFGNAFEILTDHFWRD